MPEYWLALGTNLGNRDVHLKRAMERLKYLGTVLTRSSVYETKPVGTSAEHAFLNMVCQLRTALQPFRLLRKLKQIEAELGRVRAERWGNRAIDLDIIDWEGAEVKSAILTIPHSQMRTRGFVLIPLAECCATYINRKGESVQSLVEQLSGSADINLHRAGPEARIKEEAE
jgi:2-amino-4-hydroxy-6-hydroxymethyldihydropteridine diphosphokinase